jgi:pimeloyl-ACP methyl ester carboxylesterase
MGEFEEQFVETNGIRMHLHQAGEGYPVVLCHGFPEIWYSWRHQLRALGAAGFRAIAPDQRGYGETDRPEAIEAYSLRNLVADLTGMLDRLGIGKFTTSCTSRSRASRRPSWKPMSAAACAAFTRTLPN